MAPGEYSLEFNQTCDSMVTLVLNENYNPNWEAKLDGNTLNTHLRFNIYGNGWCANITAGLHRIEIYFKPNRLYQVLIYSSITVESFLLIAFFRIENS